MIIRMETSGFRHVTPGLLLILLLAFGAGNVYAADSVKGGKLYARHCAICHGVDGISIMPDAPNFIRSERLLRPDVFILAAIKEGKNAMPSFQGMLKDQEILDIISYLRTLEDGGPFRP